MRSYALFLLLLSAANPSRAQYGDSLVQALINRRSVVREISISPYQMSFPVTPLFNTIEVLDYRRDTLRIGLSTEDAGRQRQLVFATTTTNAFTAYLTKYYTSPDAHNHLMVVIKDLWISDSLDPRYKFSRYDWNMKFRLEAYLQHPGGYIPLTLLDTTAYMHGESMQLTPMHHLPRLIAAFMDKVDGLDLEDVSRRRRPVTFSQIDSFCRSRFHFPIESDARFVKGVYASLDEFRNNKPSITNYQLVKDKHGTLELHIADENGRYIYNHTAWGFCDGERLFVMMDGNLFPVFTLNHQFYVLGSKRYSRNDIWIPLYAPLGPAAFMTGLMTVNENVTRTLRIYPMDLETGAIGR